MIGGEKEGREKKRRRGRGERKGKGKGRRGKRGEREGRERGGRGGKRERMGEGLRVHFWGSEFRVGRGRILRWTFCWPVFLREGEEILVN